MRNRVHNYQFISWFRIEAGIEICGMILFIIILIFFASYALGRYHKYEEERE